MVVAQKFLRNFQGLRSRLACDGWYAFCHGALNYARLVLDDDREIRAFPMLHLCPKKRENHGVARIHGIGRQVGKVDSKPAVLSLQIMSRLPAVPAPMHHRRSLNRDAESLSRRHDTAFVIEAPFPLGSVALLDAIALNGLRWLVKNFAALE